jgi:hypothetical protein
VHLGTSPICEWGPLVVAIYFQTTNTKQTMKPYRCADRMCGGDDCSNCHPENFRSRPNTRFVDPQDYDDDLTNWKPATMRELDRIADYYERQRKL